MITLDSLIAIALNSSPYVNFLNDRFEAVDALGYQAGRLSNPEIEFSYSPDEIYWGFSQDLPNPRLMSLERSLWKVQLDGMRLSTRRDSFQFILLIKSLYLESVFHHIRGAILQEALDTLESFRNTVEYGYRNGRFPYSHVLNLDARIEHIKGEISLARVRKENALEALSSVVGIHVDSVDFSLPQPDVPPLDILLSMVDSSFEMSEKGISLREVRLRASHERARIFPGISIDMGIKRQMDLNSILEAGFSIPIPIFDMNRGNINYYKYMEMALVNDSLYSVNRMVARLSALYRQFEALSRRLNAIREREIPLLEHSCENFRNMYMRGQASYLEVMDTFEKLMEKKMEELEYMRRKYMICMAVERLIGKCMRKEKSNE